MDKSRMNECLPNEYADFVRSFESVALKHHEIMMNNGFWDDGGNDLPKTLMLWITEVVELFEGDRKGIIDSDHIPQFTNKEEEAADIILRIMDYGVAHNWRIAESLLAKLEYNATRPHKHGKKF